MDVKTDGLAGAHLSQSAQSRMPQSATHPQRGVRGELRQDEPAESRTQASAELDERVRLIATAIANKAAAGAAPLDNPAAFQKAFETSSEIRTRGGDAWRAQAHISPRSALALLKE
jgi:hypothetical protein